MVTGLFWFDRDLRLHDHPALSRAAREVDNLLCIYVHDSRLNRNNQYVDHGPSEHRQRFLDEGLRDLSMSLASLGQTLHVLSGQSERVISALINGFAVDRVYRGETSGFYENKAIAELQRLSPALEVMQVPTHTLLSESELPFTVDNWPATFSKFRRAVEPIKLNPPESKITRLPPPPESHIERISGFNLEHAIKGLVASRAKTDTAAVDDQIALGGESAALEHVRQYFEQPHALVYKQQRNALSEWTHSTKFSLWLAQGSISVRELVDQLKQFERTKGANDSTYWIVFELLWREYFFWHAKAVGSRLFAFSGIKRKRPLTSAYAERFRRWVGGTTPYPLVNALMLELATTGYMSNRGRQIVASCLVHELSVDWRFGAAYFEQQLIDYEVGSNWGNWQYIAGVGTDARDVRRFNIEKQTQTYDPDGEYRRRWLPAHEVHSNTHQLHSVDAADWPIA